MPETIPNSTLQGDYSSLYSATPEKSFGGSFGRSWFGELLGFGAEAAEEDWVRQEQSANNALVRDLIKLNEQNYFNRVEAQKSRDWSERMSNTAYQRAMKDMKLAGLNPVLAFQQGGAVVPGAGASASSGSGSSSSGSRAPGSRSGADVVGIIARLVSGLISGSAQITAAGISAAARNSNRRR